MDRGRVIRYEFLGGPLDGERISADEAQDQVRVALPGDAFGPGLPPPGTKLAFRLGRYEPSWYEGPVLLWRGES